MDFAVQLVMKCYKVSHYLNITGICECFHFTPYEVNIVLTVHIKC